MSPEMLKKHKYSNKVDSWSLGVILYELLTNDHPYLEQNNRRIKFATLKDIKNIKEFDQLSGLSEEVRDLMSKLLNPYQNERISV